MFKIRKLVFLVVYICLVIMFEIYILRFDFYDLSFLVFLNKIVLKYEKLKINKKMFNYFIFLKVFMNCLVIYGIFYIFFIFLNNIFYERNLGYDFRNGMARR